MTSMKAAVLLGAVLVSCASFTSGQSKTDDATCSKLVGGYNTTVLMVADPGDFSGSAEAKYYLQNLENPTVVPAGMTICLNRAFGTMMGQNVTVVSSGINAQNSALCTMELLNCASHIKDFIYAGTAGFSAALGGVINPTDCMEVASPSTLTRLGDVCVSPFSNNWECRLASWSQQCGGFPNQCVEPMLTDNLTVDGLYGKCSFDSYDQASVSLADEIILATKTLRDMKMDGNSLTRNPEVSSYEELYWAAMSNGTGESFMEAYNGLGMPRVYDYNQCAETDGQFFWSGAPWDYNARQYVAYTLTTALSKPIYADEVIAVSAMEAVGVSAAMTKFHAIPGNPKVPYTFVRGSSDYVHLPLSTDGSGVWSDIETVPAVDFINGYSYAIASFSTVVLDLFTHRCLTNGGDASFCKLKAGVQYASA